MSPPPDPEPGERLDQPRGLTGVVARGAAVTTLGQLTRIGIQVVATVALARLLSPGDFGLVAMVLVFVSAADIFRDFGLSIASIRARVLTTQQRDNLFWVNTSLGALLCIIMFSASGLVAASYDQPALVAITQALSVNFLINGIATQYRSDLTRRLAFSRLVVSDVSAQLLGLAVGLTVALVLHSYWAIVAQQVTQAVVSLVVVSSFARWLPRRPRRGAGTMEFLRFGRNYVASTLLDYAANNVDTALVGYRFGATQLGLYSRAYQLLIMPLSQLRAPTTSVALPALARVEDDRARQSEVLVRGQTALGFTLVTGLAVAGGTADPLIRLLLGEQWEAAVPLFQAFTVAGAATTLGYIGNWVFLARGLSGDLVRWTAVSASVRVACILVGSLWGIVGVAVGFAVAPVLLAPASMWWLSRRTELPLARLLLGYLRIMLLALVSGVSSAVVIGLVGAGLPLLLEIGAGVLVVLAVHLVACALPVVRRDVAGLVVIARSLRRRG